ncbi:MAG TPA: hypothetical protein VFS10_02875 [Pyrinomonadaceae bacterium]|nr:hypothetical protein [Pyrinomonadaceae bacterium]
MKLITVAIVSALAGSVVALAVLFAGGEPLSAPDLLGFVPLTFFPALLLCALLYAPVLRRLKRRLGGCRPAYLFPLFSALLLNLPLFLLMLALAQAGRFFSGPGEVAIFTSAFFTSGLIFGVGFARLC